jgi:ferrous iron transport protein A
MKFGLPLSDLPKHTPARIIHIQSTNTVHDAFMLRLKELGFLPGATLQVIGYGLFGKDPIAVQINGTRFALRRQEAMHIFTKVTADPS